MNGTYGSAPQLTTNPQVPGNITFSNLILLYLRREPSAAMIIGATEIPTLSPMLYANLGQPNTLGAMTTLNCILQAYILSL